MNPLDKYFHQRRMENINDKGIKMPTHLSEEEVTDLRTFKVSDFILSTTSQKQEETEEEN